jgi:hypothetical protein
MLKKVIPGLEGTAQVAIQGSCTQGYNTVVRVLEEKTKHVPNSVESEF